MSFRKSRTQKNTLSPEFHPSTLFSCFHALSADQILKLIRAAKPTTAAIDPVSTIFIPEFTDVFSPVFQKIVNLSLESGTVPRAFKKQSLNRLSKISKERKIKALDRQGTQQQRSESPTVTQPGVRVKTRHINSTKGTSSKKKKNAPSGR